MHLFCNSSLLQLTIDATYSRLLCLFLCSPRPVLTTPFLPLSPTLSIEHAQILSALYVCLCYVLLPFGIRGVILANILAMSVRIGYSLQYIGRFFAGGGGGDDDDDDDGAKDGEKWENHGNVASSSTSLWSLRSVLPERVTSLSFFMAFVITYISSMWLITPLCGDATTASDVYTITTATAAATAAAVDGLCYLGNVPLSTKLVKFAFHIIIGVLSLGGILGTIYRRERTFLRTALQTIRRKAD